MKPTPNIRFITKMMFSPQYGEGIAAPTKVLQQWWAFDPDSYTDFVMEVNGEWRDVPLEEKNENRP